jgi:hypothetical protein
MKPKRPKARKRAPNRMSTAKLVRLAERVMAGHVPTKAEALSLAGCVLSQARGRRRG